MTNLEHSTESHAGLQNVAIAQVPRPGASAAKKKIVFLSSCPDPWGGSEELWNGTALRFAQSGHRISVVKHLIDHQHPNIRQLKKVCENIEDYNLHYEPIITRLAR